MRVKMLVPMRESVPMGGTRSRGLPRKEMGLYLLERVLLRRTESLLLRPGNMAYTPTGNAEGTLRN